MSKAILVSVALAPLVLLGGIVYFRTGRDLTTVCLVAAGVFFAIGAALIGIGSWSRKKGVVSTGYCQCFLVLILLSIVPFTHIYWIGEKEAALALTVKDAEGRPIPNAAVRLFQDDNKGRATKTLTDVNGKATFNYMFTAAGADSLVTSRGHITLRAHTLVINADGYKSIREPLTNFLPLEWDVYGPPLPDVDIRLKKNK